MICIPITETRPETFLNAIIEAAQTAGVIELRLDYLDSAGLAMVLSRLPDLACSRTLLLTFRPREQGGQRDLSLRDRQNFWRGLSPELVSAIGLADFEFDLVQSFGGDTPSIPWEKVVCSWHDFEETPDDLIERYDRMAATPAAVVKIATMAKRIGDSLRIFDLLDHAHGKKPVIALAMSLPGIATRILSPSRGGLLTFGSLRRGAESASGQPTAADLRDLYRVKQLTRDSEIYGVIGNPVGHSRSPLMHNAALAALNRNGVYLPLEVADIKSFARDLLHPKTKTLDWNLRGLSVTIPHKLAIMPFLDWIDPTARTIGAVNTVVVKDQELHGYNTDVIGAIKPLEALIDARGARAAVLGAGGSARAICYGLCERGADVTIYSRDLRKAQPLAEEFKTKTALLEDFAGEADLVINCTPIGMHGHSEGQSLVQADSLRKVKLVYDLIYTPAETALLREAKAAGCQTLGGLAMLIGQAAEQFRLWTGAEAPIEVMRQALNLPAQTSPPASGPAAD